MKKLLFSVAILAVAASCSKTEVTDVAPAAQSTAIGFSTLNDRVTKAATSNGDDYHVYAIETKSGETNAETSFYIDEDVAGSTYGAYTEDYIMSGISYYWPVSSTLDFYAYAPESLVATAISTEITIAFEAADGDVDFTMAKQEDPTVGSAVALEFSHMLSKITVEVVLADDLTDAGYYLEVTPEDQGVEVGEEVTYGPTYTVSMTTNASTGTADVLKGELTTTTTDAKAGSYSGAVSYMIMPQDAEGCTLTITGLTLYDEDGDVTSVVNKTLNAYTLTSADVVSFAGGTHYVITMTIDGSTGDGDGSLLTPIAFVSSISDNADWGTDATSSTTILITGTDTEEVEVYSTAETVAINDVINNIEYSVGSYIYDAAGIVVTDFTETNVKALTDYLGDDNYKACVTYTDGYYTADNASADDSGITIVQDVTTTVYSVSGSKFTVVTYGTPDVGTGNGEFSEGITEKE